MNQFQSHLPGVVWPAVMNPADVQILSLLFQLEQSQWWDRSRIEQQQLYQLSHIVGHARSFSPFYRQRLADFAWPAKEPLTRDEFRQIPILRRADIYLQGSLLNTTQLPPGHTPLTKISTSGSTGAPIEVQTTPITSLLFRTLGLRFHIWHQRDLAGSNMSVRLRHDRSQQVVRNARWAPCFVTGPGSGHCATRSLDELFAALLEENPNYLQAYPTIVAALAMRSAETGKKPQCLREVRTFGGVLDPDVRQLASESWGVPVTENYSAMEVGIIALQCPQSNDLHVQDESVLVEILDEAGRHCAPDEVGRVVVSVLHNFATPMIRYELGDYAEVGEPCACGRGLLTLKRIVGRELHLFTMPDGVRRVPYVRSTEFNRLAPIRQFQVSQRSLHDVDVNLATMRPLSGDEERHLTEHLQKHLHPDFRYHFHYFDEIPRSTNGKFEMYRSELTRT